MARPRWYRRLTTGNHLFEESERRMSLDGGTQDSSKGKARPGSHAKAGSHAKERNPFKVITLIVIPLLAIAIPAIVDIYIAKPSSGASDGQPQGSAPLGSRPSNPPPSAASGSASSSAPDSDSGSKASFSAPTLAPTSDSARNILMYQSNGLILDNNGCVNHHNYPSVAFWPN